MGQIRHGSATTTHAVRAAIQRSQATNAALSRELGINVKTVAKWRKRETIEDRKTGPTEPSSTVLSTDEEAMVVAFRRHTLLPLDDCLYALQPTIPYHAMIAQVDDMVGALCDLLEATGQRENTLVIFMSDHGEMLGDHGLLYKGCRFYDGLVRVPLVISHPASVPPGRRADDLVEIVDLPQTILDFADLPADPQMQGRSLHRFLIDPLTKLGRRFVTSEYFEAIRYPGSVGSRGSMYFDGRYKLCMYHDADTGELFDQLIDPHEFNDLWDDPHSQDLRHKLMERHFNAMMTRSGTGPPRLADY